MEEPRQRSSLILSLVKTKELNICLMPQFFIIVVGYLLLKVSKERRSITNYTVDFTEPMRSLNVLNSDDNNQKHCVRQRGIFSN